MVPAMSSNGPDARVTALDGLLEDSGLDAVLATKDASIAYLSGFWGIQLERFFGVVVRPGAQGALIAPALDRDSVNAAETGLDRVLYPTGASNGLPELFHALDGAKRIGVEEDHLNFARSRALAEAGFELVPSSEVVMRLREAKDAEEVEAVRRACVAIEAAMEDMWAQLRPGAVEQEVNAAVAYALSRRGATEAHAHILFGTHAANSHGSPDARVLQPGDVVCADVAAQFDGYWGDLTRCGTAGAPGDWARSAWAVVHEAYVAAVAATRVGNTARDVDAAQRAIVEAAPEIGACLHGAGHAIGTEIHEPPFLIPSSDTALREGMIFTVEPGIYNSDVGGIRLEDDVLVGPDGPVMLSSAPLELRVLGD
jgi:Xaa-Pro dipeptidase